MTKISALAAASALAGTESVPVVQSGTTKKATATDIANEATSFDAAITFLDGVSMPGVTGKGIKINSESTPSYGWRDITGDVSVRPGGNADPSFNVFRGGIRQYQFGVNEECFFVFHMPHDWAVGTDIFIHAHWAHASASVSSGAVTWGFEVTWAKGFDQAAFLTPITTSVQQTASTTQYQHMVAEVQLTAASPNGNQIDTDILETDGLFLVRCYLSANTMNGTPEPYLHTVDLHYQSTNLGTSDKAPSFYAT